MPVKILLLQNMLYVPALGGANKANRLLLEALTEKGHICRVVAPAFAVHGLATSEEFLESLRARNLSIIDTSDTACIFRCHNVEVHAVFNNSRLHIYSAEQIEKFRPDVVLASSQDPGQSLLAIAVREHPKVIYLVHAEWDLPLDPARYLRARPIRN
jgi:hypothetical protein